MKNMPGVKLVGRDGEPLHLPDPVRIQLHPVRRDQEPRHGRRVRLKRVQERLEAEREAAVAEAPDSSVALVRIDQAMAKVKEYMDEKFARKRRYSLALNGGRTGHADGRSWGRAAADRMAIGRKGVGGTAVKGVLAR